MGSTKERLFRFKKFSVRHSESSMPIGVDGVLVASWVAKNLQHAPQKILDVGTGCGIIALIMAEFYSSALITAIDIDSPSVDEANYNFENSSWTERLTAKKVSFQDFSMWDCKEKFDLIISNPPFFISGITQPYTRRERARHEASLPLNDLAHHACNLLTDEGYLCVILPFGEIATFFIEKAIAKGFTLISQTDVKGNPNRPFKRSLLLFSRSKQIEELRKNTLILEEQPGVPTEAYKELCRELYLNF